MSVRECVCAWFNDEVDLTIVRSLYVHPFDSYFRKRISHLTYLTYFTRLLVAGAGSHL